MDEISTLMLTPAVLVMGLIELFKIIWRKFVVKNPDYDFPPNFYTFINPVLQVLVLPLMALLIPEQYPMPTDWVLFIRTVLLVVINSYLTTWLYNNTIAKARVYRKAYTMRYK